MKKKTLTGLFVLLLSNLIFCQGNINSVSISPSSPSINDTIYVYADLQFPNSSCEFFNSSQTITANNIEITTQHCTGMLTSICNITDTIKINPLPTGYYSLNLTLTSDINYGIVPCNGGNNADDLAALQFNVTDPLSVLNSNIINYTIWPNPSNEQFNISLVNNIIGISNIKAFIYNVEGKLILEKHLTSNSNLSIALSNGLYFIQLKNSNNYFSDIKKIIIKN
jgi:hypothetical protein